MQLSQSILAASTLLLHPALAVPDVVDLSHARYQGQPLPNGVSQWLGIRYAAPPLGDLRFAPPQDPPQADGVQSAMMHGKYCLGTGSSPTDPKTSEDCLFLDVQAPTNATPNSKLPVFLYVQGGGFSINSNPNTNASGLIIASDFNIVVVSLNYRVGPYGFMSDGDRIPPNIGLMDQRKVLDWVQRHISKFGGDPNHVVLGGSSAGAASVTYHLSAKNASRQRFFHGAIAESPSFAGTLTVQQSLYQYNQFATRSGCVGKNSLGCLRNMTAESLQEQNFNIPLPGAASPPNYMWLPVIDSDFVTDYTYRLFREGKFAKVPTIYGDDNNGGTKFAPRTTSTLAESNQYILDQYPLLTLDALGEISELYPNPNQTCPNIGCYWRHASNVYQETRYMCPGFYVTSAVSKAGQNAWSYLWNVTDPAQEASGLGVPHTVELAALWGADYFPSPPDSYRPRGINAAASPLMQYYWINFIRFLNPNGPGDGPSKHPEWSSWAEKSDARLAFQTTGIAALEPLDDGLKTRCDFWFRHALKLTQ